MNYEKPKLNEIGKATDIVLGAYDQGFDLDGTIIPDGAEFAPDYFSPDRRPQ